jgi:hypothetical protein
MTALQREIVKIAAGNPKMLVNIWTEFETYKDLNESRDHLRFKDLVQELHTEKENLCSIHGMEQKLVAESLCNLESSQVLPLLQLAKCFIARNKKMGDILLDSLRSHDEQLAFSGAPFENFHAVFESFYRMYWVDSNSRRPDSVPISALYKTTSEYSPIFEDTQLALYDSYLYEETMDFFSTFFVGKDGPATGKYDFNPLSIV